MKLSLPEARELILRSQALNRELGSGTPKQRALTAIKHLGYVQIDTISVVERAHHHVLWTRVPEYRPAELLELQRERKIFEYWYHAASYLPMTDYRFCLPRMQLYRKGKQHFFAHDRKTRNFVLDRIRAEGPLQSKDFESTARRREWFHWKPAKRALEHLFMAGELMVSERKGFQKVYDLSERVLPSAVETTAPTPLEFAKYLACTSLRHRGLALEPELRYLRKGIQTVMKRALRELCEAGEISAIEVAGFDDLTFYALTRALEEPRSASSFLHILSPFDPLVIQRKPTEKIFGFDYQIECYTPEPKRKYGYFCLPILWKDRFLGRIDAKADRKAGELRLLSIHLEPDVKISSGWTRPLKEKLLQFARFNQCASWNLGRSSECGEAPSPQRGAPSGIRSAELAGRSARSVPPLLVRALQEDSFSSP